MSLDQLFNQIARLQRNIYMEQKRIIAVLFFMVEAVSFTVDQFGGSKLSFRLASFILSLFGFIITIYSFIIERRLSSETEKQHIIVVEVVFSAVQLIVSSLCMILKLSGVKTNLNASLLPLAFAAIVVWFTFKAKESISLDSSSSNNNHQISSNTWNHENTNGLVLDINQFSSSSTTPTVDPPTTSQTQPNQIQRVMPKLRKRETIFMQSDQLQNTEEQITENHKKLKLIDDRPKVHECYICGLEFSTGQALDYHMRGHTVFALNEISRPELPLVKNDISDKRVFQYDLNLTPHDNYLDLRLWNFSEDDFEFWMLQSDAGAEQVALTGQMQVADFPLQEESASC